MTSKALVRLAGILALSLVAAPVIDAQTRKSSPRRETARVIKAPTVSPDAQRRTAAFRSAWHTINSLYYDKTFGGLDWAAIGKEYETKVLAAKTDAEFHSLLTQMIARLGRSHLAVIVPEYFEQLETAKKEARIRGRMLAKQKSAEAGEVKPEEAAADEDLPDTSNKRYGIGIETRLINDQLVITRVEKQSGALIAGLKPGYVLQKVNGISMEEMLRRATLAGLPPASIRYLLPLEVERSFLNGPAETDVFLTCLDANDKPVEFKVPRLELAGETVSISKDLPEQFLKFEATSLDKNVGYIRFSAFALPVVERFCAALEQMRDKKALIVDLRGNIGGILGTMIGLSGMMTDRDLVLGTYVARQGKWPFSSAAKNKRFTGKVIVLVDRMSMSAAELFAAGLQGNQRAVVVGEKTGGQALPAAWTKLTTGAVMMYPVANFITPKGTSLEGTGLEPDHAVSLDRKELLAGNDAQLNKALAVAADDSIKLLAAAVASSGSVISASSPPPPAPRNAAGKAAVNNSSAPPPPAVSSAPVRKTAVPSQARGLKVLNDFTAAVGGSEAVRAISSYELNGTITAKQYGDAEGSFYAARQSPDNYVTIYTTPEVGEVREIYNATGAYLQTDYGAEQSFDRDRFDTASIHVLAPFLKLLQTDSFSGVKYEGEYAVDGTMMKVLSATDGDGSPVGLTFEASTGLLRTYTHGGALYNLRDYRKVGSLMLPHEVEVDGMMHLFIKSMTVNPKLDPAIFQRKEKCFDKVN